MLFNSITFLAIFLPCVLISAYSAQKIGNKCYLIVVILSSLIFYSFNNIYNLPVLCSSILVNFCFGRLISNSKNPLFLVLGVLFNLSILGWFKYRSFFFNIDTGNIALPLAISFITFQQIAYIADIFRGKIKDFSFIDYVFCVTFFPHLIAGPIVKYDAIKYQIARISKNLPVKNVLVIREALVFFSLGLAKKVLIADPISSVADSIFGAVNPPSMFSAWLGSCAFSFQIFYDFSAYSEMALGLGLLFGIRLPINFNAPYQSHSISEFWRRWHITLGDFLRENLYIPMGGSRYGRAREIANLMVTMIIGGLWHGAAWNFIIWGGAHGLMMSMERLLSLAPRKPPKILAIIFTCLLVHFSWVIFRSRNIEQALDFYEAMVGFTKVNAVQHPLPDLASTMAILIAVFLLVYGKPIQQIVKTKFMKSQAGYIVTGLLFGVSFLTVAYIKNGPRFIYFQF